MATAKKKPITERIKSYEDACKELSRKVVTETDFHFLPTSKEAKAAFAYHKLTTIAEALNEGHVFDWNNYKEYKWYPWFDMETYGDAPAGSGFSFYDSAFVHRNSGVSARLCFKTEALAEYAAKTFIEDYKELFRQ